MTEKDRIDAAIHATLRLLDVVVPGFDDDDDDDLALAFGGTMADDDPEPPPASRAQPAKPGPSATPAAPTAPATPATLARRRGDDWPAPMRPEAFTGVAGQIVRDLAPYSEADDAAVLTTLLAAMGNLAGPGVGWTVSGRRHGLRFWPVLVGPTGKGRKGTSW